MLSNPITTLDRRIQMRGNRPWIIWSGYLLFLTALTLSVYDGILGSGTKSLSSTQSELVGFAMAIQSSVIALVLMISVSVTASSVAIERQRRMIDLVEVAPVSPVKFLFGKLLSSVRLCVLLLALALPFFATGYMYGGATLSDILIVFLHIICNVLVVCSISLAISSPINRPIVAIMLSFAASGVYQLIVSGLSAATTIGGVGNSVPPFAGLSAFSAMEVAQLPTELFRTQMPVWPITVVATLIISGLLIMGSASAVTRYGSIETKRFRIAILSIWTLTCAAFALSPAMLQKDVLSAAALLFAFFFTFAIPFFSTYETLSDRRDRYEGTFKPKLLFHASSASALPFTLVIAIQPIALLLIAALLNRGSDMDVYVARAIFLFGLVALSYATSRVTSSITKRLAPARLLSFLAWALFWFGLPIAVATASTLNSMSGGGSAWYELVNPYLLFVASSGTSPSFSVVPFAIGLGVLMFIVAAVFLKYSINTMEKGK